MVQKLGSKQVPVWLRLARESSWSLPGSTHMLVKRVRGEGTRMVGAYECAGPAYRFLRDRRRAQAARNRDLSSSPGNASFPKAPVLPRRRGARPRGLVPCATGQGWGEACPLLDQNANRAASRPPLTGILKGATRQVHSLIPAWATDSSLRTH